MGAFHPSPPDWADALIELVDRLEAFDGSPGCVVRSLPSCAGAVDLLDVVDKALTS